MSAETPPAPRLSVTPLDARGFGVEVTLDQSPGLAGATAHCTLGMSNSERARRFVAAAEGQRDAVRAAINAGRGLLLIRGLEGIASEPGLLVRLSQLFGTTEDYREGRDAPAYLSDDHPEIAVISNAPPSSRDIPELPQPELTASGTIPTQYPHRRGWHTDDSFRRPPPDFSLFYAVRPTPRGQGQTLFADMSAAWEALPPELRHEVEHTDLVAAHTNPWISRSRDAVLSGASHHAPPARAQAFSADAAPSVWQPCVCDHPETGRRALYLSDCCQLDFVDGPISSPARAFSRGPGGDGDTMMTALVSHSTQERFVMVHEWERGDLVVYDNRTTMHCATWFDGGRRREMWRTFVRGNSSNAFGDPARPSWRPGISVDTKL
jgi:taurine dioxygenase